MTEKHPNYSSYVYCANNPVNLIDPDGRDWFVNDQGFYLWSNNSSVSGFSYAGNVLPPSVSRYQILEQKNGRLFHKNTDDWLNRNINSYLGTNLNEKLPYDRAQESFNDELLTTAVGVGIGKLGGLAFKALSRAGGSLWNVEGGWLARGFVYEEMLGGNLAKGYPVIDKFVKGVATSIKTLDLRTKGYQNSSKVLSVLKKYIKKLEAFEGVNRGGINTTGGKITEKVLEVGVPKGASAAQVEAIQAAVKYGEEVGIKVNVRIVK
ncbi:endonuclease toxin domain-containing protein [Flavobacterium geliluteum]|uniref:CdiA toxin EC869-like domain-containing protein n=1 Tax=Flavobacterium geliluteum TaxID=2816120 RepID=A0A940XAM5_9FLAO|nr:hypothetical protein [Flavobacterium geliluteum]MBP4140040.1 hypothetical protein [Flavobacterium geliluteum]